MKNIFSSILSVLTALLVLFSTFSFTVDKHYCMGKVVNISLLGSSVGCDMPEEKDDCNNLEDKIVESDCCFDTVEIIESNNSELKLDKEISAETVQFAAIFFTTYLNLFGGLDADSILCKDYNQPLLTSDLHILHDSFLI